MSSRIQPIFVSPSLALFIFAFCTVVLADSADQGAPGSASPNGAKAAAFGAAKDLVELMADRLVLVEAIAQRKWNDRALVDDDSADAVLLEASERISKESGVDPAIADLFVKGQMSAYKERQRQLFAVWKKAGVDGFDEVPDLAKAVLPGLEKNLREQMKKLQDLKPVLCSSEMIKALREIASNIFARRALDKELLNPILEPLDVKAREELGSCASAAPKAR